MQNQEILAELTRARQAQARALQRFAHARQRLAQLEARQQALNAYPPVSTPTDQASPLPSTPFPEQVLTPLPDQPGETDAESQHPTFLPESGELELRVDFTPATQIDDEQTERIAPAQTPAPQADNDQTERIAPTQPSVLPRTPVPRADVANSYEANAAENPPGEALTYQAEERS